MTSSQCTIIYLVAAVFGNVIFVPAFEAVSQRQCDGLTLLAITANRSSFLQSCTRDSDCTQITCTLSADPETLLIVQEAALRVIPCSFPLPQVEFDLLNDGAVGFMQLVNSTGEVVIMINNGIVQVPFGTLISFINHTENGIGIMMEYLPPSTEMPVTLFDYTVVPLDMSACPTTEPATTDVTSSGTIDVSEPARTTTSGTVQFLCCSWLIISVLICTLCLLDIIS